MALFIGIDSGTQSTKAVVVDLETGATIARARSPHTLIAGLPEGHMEQHPEEWVRALETVITEVAGTIDRSQVKGIGVSGQQHGFVPLDRKGAVIRPAKLWCDTSTVEECAWLTKALGGPKGVLRETGVPFLPGYTAPKILWLKRHEPQHFRRLRQVALPHDYLNYHLTGKLRMEYGDASGTALLDVRKRAWSERTAQLIDPDLIDWLPKVRASDQPAGILTPALTRQFGFRPGVVVSAGGGDNMMGAIGTGNVTPGVVTASFGTSGTIYAYSDEPVVDSMGEVAPFCSSTGGWLPLICTMNVTEVTEQVRHLAQLTRAGFESALASVPWSADGPIFLPYLAGERTPNLPNASGAIFGLKPGKLSAPHLARAAVEGVTLGMNYGPSQGPWHRTPGNSSHRRRGQIRCLAPDHGRRVCRSRRRDGGNGRSCLGGRDPSGLERRQQWSFGLAAADSDQCLGPYGGSHPQTPHARRSYRRRRGRRTVRSAPSDLATSFPINRRGESAPGPAPEASAKGEGPAPPVS